MTGLIYILISLGGLVRNAGAGLSCPDWPLCYGQVVPPMDARIFLEWFHRLIAGSVSVGLAGLSAVVFWSTALRRAIGRYCSLALALLAAQVVLGGLTVLGLLAPKWVASHLAVGLALFGTVLWMALRLKEYNQASVRSPKAGDTESRGYRSWLAPLACVAVYGQILLGGLVSSNYAGLACPDFPTCNGLWLPAFEGLVRFQVLHRAGAALATIAIAALCVRYWRAVAGKARLALRALPALLALQIGLGVGSVWLGLPLLMSVAHLATAAALFGAVLVVTYEVRHGS